MWDPVKDCSDPNSTQADVPGLLSAHHASAETLMHSTASGFTSTGPLSTLPPHFRDTSGQEGQQSVESMTRGSVLTGIQPRHHGNLHDHDHDHAQEQGQMTGIETRMHTSIASPEVAHPLDPQTNMSQATSMMRDAETLAQQSRRSEAIQAYEEACALLQDVIIRSFSLEERMACNNMRTAWQERLDSLLRESTASPSDPLLGQNDQYDEDGPRGGKPQYSLEEDWMLCRKLEEDLSWQEVAQTPIFKGKRKHRSLSQRKHTISKMGPSYHEAEEPWTEDENLKLRALGDAKRTLGEIHRKFRSRNAERCLEQYYYLKGHRGRASASRQVSHAPAIGPLDVQGRRPSRTVEENAEHLFRSDASTIEPLTNHHPVDPAIQQSYQPSSAFGPTSPFSAFTLRPRTPRARSPFSRFAGAEVPNGSTFSMSLNNAASTEALAGQTQSSSRASRQQSPTAWSCFSSSATAASSPKFSPKFSSFSTSSTSSFAMMSPHRRHESPDSHSAAANGVRKSWGTAHPETS